LATSSVATELNLGATKLIPIKWRRDYSRRASSDRTLFGRAMIQ
jgi:hypothetical protein